LTTPSRPCRCRARPVTVLDLGSSEGQNAVRHMASIAKAYTGFSRAVSEPVVRAAFNQPEREVETVECLYERIQARLLAEPERYSWRYILVAAQLTRR
jgi:hypothetical protein